MDPSSKRPNVAETVRNRVENDRWRIHPHAEDRMSERHVIRPEVRQILTSGWCEPDYDEWNEEHESWNYALEGYTVDNRRLRVAVAFDPDDDAIVVTVVDPEARGP